MYYSDDNREPREPLAVRRLVVSHRWRARINCWLLPGKQIAFVAAATSVTVL